MAITKDDLMKVIQNAPKASAPKSMEERVRDAAVQARQKSLLEQAGLTTFDKDSRAYESKLASLQKRLKNDVFVDQNEIRDLQATGKSLENRAAAYETYLRDYASDQKDALGAASSIKKNLSDQLTGLSGLRDFYGKFENADAFKTYTEKKKREDYLINEYDLDAAKKEIDAAKAAWEQLKQTGGGVSRQNNVEIEAARKRYESLAEEYRQAENLKRLASYDTLTQNADFAAKSVAGDDALSRFLNMDEEARKNTDTWTKILGSLGKGALGVASDLIGLSTNDLNDLTDKYHAMTDEQRKVYNYLNNTKGSQAARDYLYDIGDDLSYRAAVQQKKALDALLPENGFGRTVGNLADIGNALRAGTSGAVTSFGEGIYQTFAQNDRVLNTSVAANRFGLDREEAGKVQKVLLDLAQATGNMLPSVVLSAATGVPVLGAGMMGIQAKGAAYNQAIKEGYSPTQAQTYSTMVGALEGGLSYALTGIGKGATKMFPALGKAIDGISNGFLRGLASWGVEAAGEGLEEGLTEFFDPFLRYFVTGKYEGVNWQDVGYSAFLGALSGGLLEGTPAAMKAVSLPDATAEAFKTKYDTGNGYEGFSSRLFADDTLLSLQTIEMVKADNAEGAVAALNKGLRNYRFAKEYARQVYGVTAAADIDARIKTIESLKASIKAGKFNAQSAETALRRSSDVWQIAAENNDAVAAALAGGEISNSKAENAILKDRGTARAFERLTGIPLEGTFAKRRNTVKAAGEAFARLRQSDAAKKVSALLTENETEASRSVREQNRRTAIDTLAAYYHEVEAEKQKALQNGNNAEAGKLATLQTMINRGYRAVQNNHALYFASLDGSTAVHGRISETALRDQKTTDSDIAGETLGGLDAADVEMLTKAESTQSIKSVIEAVNAVKQKLDGLMQDAEGDELATLQAQYEAVDRYGKDLVTLYQNRLDVRRAEINEGVRERIGEFQKAMARYGVTVRGESGGHTYSVDGKTVTRAEARRAQREEGKSASVKSYRGDYQNRVITLAEDLADGTYTVLNSDGVLESVAVSDKEAVDVLLLHEAFHYAVEQDRIANGGHSLLDAVLRHIAGTRFDKKFELAHRLDGKAVSQEAQRAWEQLKAVYEEKVKQDHPDMTDEAVRKIVTDAYLYEEIAADYIGALAHASGESSLTLLARENLPLFRRIKEALRRLWDRIRGKRPKQAAAAQDLIRRMEEMSKRYYGRQEKGALDTASEKAAESPVGDDEGREGANKGEQENDSEMQEDGVTVDEEGDAEKEAVEGEIKKRYSVGETEDGINYVRLDGNIFLRPDGTEMSPTEAYNALVGTQITLKDGDVINFIKKLPDVRLYHELFRKYPGHDGSVNIKPLNEAINKNIVDVFAVSNAKERNEKQIHEHEGIVDFDLREVYIADDRSAYRLELYVANLTDGSKAAYVKRYVEKADPEIAEKIKKAETVRQTHLNQPSDVEGVKTIDAASTKDSIAQADEKVNRKFSISEKMDLDYLSAVERQDMEKAQSLVDEAAARSGYSRRMYHGSKNGGGFTVFRDWGYFTENRDYAKRYAQRDNEKSLYEVYVKMERPFDTRDPDTKEIFEENIRPEYGTSEIQDSGLPDWTDGYDIADYIDENDLDFDSIVLDEGGDMVNGKPVSRGLSYVVKQSAQVKSADPVTYDDNGNVVPLSERFNEKESDIRYSISETLEADLDSILDGTFDASRNELYLGETSNFLTDVIGADSLSLFMPASKAYSSLVTKEDYEKKPYYSEQDNYHGIGKKDFIEILEKSEHPIAAFASPSDEKGNKRQNRIVLVTDKIVRDVETGKDGYAVVIEEVDGVSRHQGKQIKANKAITIYPRTQIANDVLQATADGRLLDITKKGEQLFAGRRGSNPQATIQRTTLKNNIAHFWENVKWLDEKNKISSSEGKATPTAMQEALQKAGYDKQYMQNGENDTSRHSVSEEVAMDEGAVGYEELKRQVAELRERNFRLTQEMVLSHGSIPSGPETVRVLKELLSRYEATVPLSKIETEFQEIVGYLYRRDIVKRDDKGRFIKVEKAKEVDASVLQGMVQRLATRIFDSAVDVDENYESYTELLKTLHNTPIGITEDMKAAFGEGWNEFRKQNFGRLNLRNDSESNLGAMYQELAAQYPEIFDDAVTDASEQLKAIAEASKTIRATGLDPKNIYGPDGDAVIQEIAYDLMEAVVGVERYATFADKAQQRVEAAEAAGKQAVATETRRGDFRVAERRLADAMYYGKKIAEIRRRYEAKIDTLTDNFATKVKNRSEEQQARYQKKMIEKRGKDLAKRLAKPTKAKHIPEEMVADVYHLLKSITWATKTKVDRDTDQQILAFLETVEKRYDEKQLTVVDGVGFPEALKNDIRAFPFRALDSQNAQQLHGLNELLRRAIFAINSFDKVFHSGEKASVESLKAFDHFRTARKEMAEAKWGQGVVDYILNYAEDPEAFFTILNVPELTDAYHRIAAGQDKLAKNVKTLTGDLANAVGEDGVPKAWREQVSEYTIAHGVTLRMTPAQLMSLYLYSKQSDSRACLLHNKGGIAVAATEHKLLLTDEKGRVIETNELKKLKNLKDVRHIETAARKIGGMAQLSEESLDELLGHLTKEQREVADRISTHLNTTVADMANETSLETEGYRKFVNENYFPMIVFDRSKSVDEVIRDMHGQIMTEGFTKERSGLAGKKLIVDDIFSVVNRHDVAVAQYNAYKKALLDYKKLLTIRPEGNSSLESQISSYFGVNKKNRVNDFLNNFVLDVQGVQMATGEETLLSEKFLRNYKAAQVAANLSVVAKQPTSILRAMPEFTAKGIQAMKPPASRQSLKADIEEMQEYSGLAFFKANGYSEYANARSFEELYNRNAFSLRDRFDDAMSKGAEQMDLMTWAAIWRAAKADTNSMEEATAKFNEVIRKTQVVDTALTSSRITKQSGLMKMAFAFRNEPLKSFNYIRATLHDYAVGKEGSGKKLAVVLASAGINSLLNAAITAAVSMMRDDEEDTAEEFFIQTIGNFGSNFLSDTLIITGDIYDAITAAFAGRKVERMDLAAITDTVEALLGVYKFIVTPQTERKDTFIKLWHNLTKAISNLTGIPISNFSRAQHTLGSLIGGAINDPWWDYLLASRYYNANGIDNTQVKQKFRSILTKALNDGDYEGFAKVKNELRSKGFSTAEIEKAIANSDVFYEAFNKGPEAFRKEIGEAQKYDPTISSDAVMSALKSRKTDLVGDLYDAAKVGDKRAMQAARESLLALRDVETKRLLTDREIDKLLQDKYEKQLKSEVKARLADLYGTPVYETVKRVILSEYRKFGVTSEEIDRIARSLQ